MCIAADYYYYRAKSDTLLNSTSSRSHAVYSVTLSRALGGKQITSVFQVVDLAGAERRLVLICVSILLLGPVIQSNYYHQLEHQLIFYYAFILENIVIEPKAISPSRRRPTTSTCRLCSCGGAYNA